MKRAIAVALLLATPALAEPVVSAGAFVDSIGINVHLHYTDTAYYQKFPLVQQALLALHVHHLRDGVVVNPIPLYLQRFRLLATLGMHTTFITQPNQSAVQLSDFTTAAGPALEALEGPNELDNGADPNWAATLRTYLPALYAFTSARGITDIGPSLVKAASYPALGNISQWQNFANLHNYPGGRNPGTQGWGDNGYGSFAYQLANLRYTSPGQPIMTTETGYDNDPSSANFVPQSVAAKYMPRLLLLQYMEGVRRTYLYELLSSGTEDYGLLTAQAAPKPAFRAVAALTSLLDEPATGATPTNVTLSITGTDTNVRHLLLRKADGTLYLALWVESPGYDVPSRTLLTVPTQNAHITLPAPAQRVVADHWQPDGSVTATSLAPAVTLDVSVTDLLTIYELTFPFPDARRATPAPRSSRSS